MSTLVDIAYGTKLVAITCGECHIPFGIPEGMYDKVRRDGSWFHCPNGHSIRYAETENQRLRRELDNATATKRRLQEQRDKLLDDVEHEKARVNGYKGALAKSKKRAAAGVCPVPGCKRSFANVARHVERQHPGFAEHPEVNP